MIKIIKIGHPVYRKTCPLCGCVFTYEDEDIYTCGSEMTIGCPCCNTSLKVSKCDVIRLKKDIPDEYEFPPQTVEAISGVSPV